jgi:hypothetical protein
MALVTPRPPSAVSPCPSALKPCLHAALLLAAGESARALGLSHPSVTEILECTGAGRSRAYELRGELLRRLPELQRSVGRPPQPPVPPLAAELRAELSAQMLGYVIAHPGSIAAGAERYRYSDGVRRFTLELRERHAQIALDAFARAVRIPVNTIADWLRTPSAAEPPAEAKPTPDPALLRIETLLEAWRRWSGDFGDFCTHVREHLRIDYGHTTIGRILEDHGERHPRRRPGRSPDEKALRGQFETFFPGAQWSGDGSPIAVEVAGERFVFNLELIVDPHTGAFVGADIREEEDGAAVAAAIADGVETTGAPPLALLLDNRPCNHCPAVHEALEETLLIPSTPGRPQGNPTEGGFGLFQQQTPLLVLRHREPALIARDLLRLVFQVWGRTLNHKPRDDRKGRSRVQLYTDEVPTPDQVAEARAALKERLRKQRLAAQTRRARLDPTVRRLLDEAFARLGLDDPDGNLRDAIARYPHDAVLAAVATFEGKRKAGTLPDDANARYLLGIARNITAEDEGLDIAEILWSLRLAAHDQALERLEAARQRAAHHAGEDYLALLIDHLDRALATDRRIDRFFWLKVAADVATGQPSPRHEALFRTAARRIHATHRVPHRDRLAATRFLAAKLLPAA